MAWYNAQRYPTVIYGDNSSEQYLQINERGITMFPSDEFYIYGGKGNDKIIGTDRLQYFGVVTSYNLGGRDTLVGGLGPNRTLHSGKLNLNEADSDTIYGGSDDDLICGGDYDPYSTNRSMDGNDFLYGEEGNDRIYGDRGNDLLNGGSEDDLLVGGAGNDTLIGGTGKDKFKFDSPSEGIDTITDFSVVDDTIVLSKSAFGLSFKSGTTIPSTAFRKSSNSSSAALTSSQRFIYVSLTGGLYFDKDGTGSAPGVQIAALSAGLAFTNSDIVAQDFSNVL